MRDLEKQKAWKRQWRKENPEEYATYQRKYRTLWRYGLTVEQYDAMVVEQGGVCKICQEPCTRKPRLSVDHSHATGEVRGLLCHDCNIALGLLRDDPDVLLSAVLYLQGDSCMGFRDRIAAYNAQKDTKVNPPEAAKVLETKSEPEVENVKPEAPSTDAPVAAVEPSAPASVEAPKAKRGRPAGSKNSAKPPEPEPTTEATSPAPSAVEPREMTKTTEELVAILTGRGYSVTLTS